MAAEALRLPRAGDSEKALRRVADGFPTTGVRPANDRAPEFTAAERERIEALLVSTGFA